MAKPVVASGVEYSSSGAGTFQLASGSFQVSDNFGPWASSGQAAIITNGCTMIGNSQNANDATLAAFLLAAKIRTTRLRSRR